MCGWIGGSNYPPIRETRTPFQPSFCSGLLNKLVMGKLRKEKVGNKYGYLTVLEDKGMIDVGRAKLRHMVLCKCVCGNLVNKDLISLKTGDTRSCGCLKKEQLSQRSIRHRLRKHKLYYKWSNIKQRCTNPNSASYKNYGGRGITVCDEWLNNPEAFIIYCIKLPNWNKPKYTIDRINNNGNYEPNNIRFSTRHIQVTNVRKRKSKTGYTGIYEKCNKFSSCIDINRVTIFLGVYCTIKDAVNARNNYITSNNLTEYKIQLV